MNYIIFDLEFNQLHPDHKENKTDENTKLPFEIIQIGAFKINEDFKVISTFNALIKPNLYKVIHPYVQDLTKISEEDLVKCKSFSNVYKDFTNFIGKNPCVFCVWGKADIKELIRNIKFYNLDYSLLPTKYIDIQGHASKYFNMQKGMKIGLKTAVEQLGLEIKSDFHDAFNDAYYTTEVFKRIHNKNIKALTYSHSISERKNKQKEKIDLPSLIEQFEKMYKRNLTNEEKEMVKLAYIMGKTNQFTNK